MEKININELCEAIKIKCDNHLEINTIKNVLLAKVICLAGLKNLSFDSDFNKFGPVPFSHFGVSFIPSGGNKNNLINMVDYIFDFINEEIDIINKKIRQKYIEEELENLSDKDKKKNKKRIEREAEKQEQLTRYINDGSPAGLYNTAELIDQLQKGFICFKNTEFSSYYTQAAYNKLSNNQLFLDCLYDLWDGVFSAARKIKGLSRKEITKITTSVIFMSSFIKMQDVRIMNAYKDDLLTGSVRRFLFVFDYLINYFANPPKEPTKEERAEANKIIDDYKKYLQSSYIEIEPNSTYIIETNTIDAIDAWYKTECMLKLKELAKKSSSINNEILKVYIFNCRWTITKLLSAYHLLNEPQNLIITNTYLEEVKDFWKKSFIALENILTAKNLNVLDNFVNCFIDNIGKDLKKGEICKSCDISPNDFKKLYEDNINDVIADLADKGYQLSIYKGRANTLIHRCEKITSIIPHLINVSVAKLKSMNETPTKFEYQELQVDEFIKLIKTPNAFVACELKDGKRESANNIGNQNTIWLDFDDVKSMEGVLSSFEQYSYIAYTSKNHQKEKNGNPPSDRFRLILFTKTLMPTDTKSFKNVMKNLINYYGADKNCSDLARFLWSNPQAIIKTNKGNLFDWRSLNVDYSEQYEEQKTYILKPIKKGNYNSDLNEAIMTETGDRILQVYNVQKGQRNPELFRIAVFLCHLVADNQITKRVAEEKMKDILSRIDKTDFSLYEQERMIQIVRDGIYQG